MRKRGASLNSPESEFMFGGPENEQVYTAPDGSIEPYERSTAAVDSMINDGTLGSIDPLLALKERDKRVKQIGKSISMAPKIEAQRRLLARFFNRYKSKDS